MAAPGSEPLAGEVSRPDCALLFRGVDARRGGVAAGLAARHGQGAARPCPRLASAAVDRSRRDAFGDRACLSPGTRRREGRRAGLVATGHAQRRLGRGLPCRPDNDYGNRRFITRYFLGRRSRSSHAIYSIENHHPSPALRRGDHRHGRGCGCSTIRRTTRPLSKQRPNRRRAVSARHLRERFFAGRSRGRSEKYPDRPLDKLRAAQPTSVSSPSPSSVVDNC